jgi:hypothetical protein
MWISVQICHGSDLSAHISKFRFSEYGPCVHGCMHIWMHARTLACMLAWVVCMHEAWARMFGRMYVCMNVHVATPLAGISRRPTRQRAAKLSTLAPGSVYSLGLQMEFCLLQGPGTTLQTYLASVGRRSSSSLS